MQVSTFHSKYLLKSEYINRFAASPYCRREGRVDDVDCGDVVDTKGLRWGETSFKKLANLMTHLSDMKLITLKTIAKQSVRSV